MTRAELMKQLAEIATRPLLTAQPATAIVEVARKRRGDLYVCSRTRRHAPLTAVAASPAYRSPCCPVHAARVSSSVATSKITCTCCARAPEVQGRRRRPSCRALHRRAVCRYRRMVGTGAQYQRAWLDMYGARTLLPRPAES